MQSRFLRSALSVGEKRKNRGEHLQNLVESEKTNHIITTTSLSSAFQATLTPEDPLRNAKPTNLEPFDGEESSSEDDPLENPFDSVPSAKRQHTESQRNKDPTSYWHLPFQHEEGTKNHHCLLIPEKSRNRKGRFHSAIITDNSTSNLRRHLKSW
jgi:hypothetical protein